MFKNQKKSLSGLESAEHVRDTEAAFSAEFGPEIVTLRGPSANTEVRGDQIHVGLSHNA